MSTIVVIKLSVTSRKYFLVFNRVHRRFFVYSSLALRGRLAFSSHFKL